MKIFSMIMFLLIVLAGIGLTMCIGQLESKYETLQTQYVELQKENKDIKETLEALTSNQESLLNSYDITRQKVNINVDSVNEILNYLLDK